MYTFRSLVDMLPCVLSYVHTLYHTLTLSQVHFILELLPNKMQECIAEGLESKFKMTNKFSTR